MVSEPTREGEWRGLEPASILVNLLPQVWRTLRSLWYLLIPIAMGGTAQGALDLSLLLLFFATAVGRTLVHYLTLRYRLHEGRLEIAVGLIGRRHRVLDPARIQNVAIVQNVFHRMAGLVELRVDTAGEASNDGLLSAIAIGEAERLRDELDRARRSAQPSALPGATPEAAPEELGRISALELLGFGVSSGGIGASILVVGLGMDIVGQLAPEQANRYLAGANPLATAGLALVAVAGAYIASVSGGLLRWYGFRLIRSDRGIATEAGLLTRRRVEIPPRKVQILRVDEPVMRRLMGYATVQIETAAAPIPGENNAAETMIPMVAEDDLASTMGLILPRLPADLWNGPMEPAARGALALGLLSATARWGVFAGALIAADVGLWPLALVLWGWVRAALDWRVQGWRITPDVIITRAGFPTRRTWIVPRDKVQSTHLQTGPLMRWLGVGRVVIWVAGTRVAIPLATVEAAGATFTALTGDSAAMARGAARPA